MDKVGFICKSDLQKIVNQVYHLVPEDQKQKMSTQEMFAGELMTEMDKNEVGKGIVNNQTWLCLKDGVIREDELVAAVLRSEHLTTMLVNKIMIRFHCACHKISTG